MPHILVLGAGLAALTLAETLRAKAYPGDITLLGDEPVGPYHRPPLSKAYLLGTAAEAQLQMRAPELLARKNIRLLTGRRAIAIDRQARQVRLADGDVLSYDELALCTGARPRPLRLEGEAVAGVHVLRTLADAKALTQALAAAKQVAIIGGGFIGLEVAAAARKQGKQVTVIEAADRLLGRVTAAPISDFFLGLHRHHGVEIALNAQLSAVDAQTDGLRRLRCEDGREFLADMLVAGIGAAANDELAHAAGLECARGVVVDACSRTADAAIVAAGDCCARRLDDGRLLRLESVQNATEQAKSAAHALLGRQRPVQSVPWFWSDQYDIKLQTVGLSTDHDRVVIRGNPADKRYSVFYFRAGKLIAVDTINQAAEHMLGRKLLEHGIDIDPERLGDPDYALGALFDD